MYQIHLSTLGKLGGVRLAHSIRVIKRGKDKGKTEVILKVGKRKKRMLNPDFKIIGEI